MATQYPYAYNPPPPQGWHPPYQGAAPPMPAGVKVNPQQWQTGVWSFNPAYNMQRPPAQHVPWMPGQAWPQMGSSHQAQQPNFNPYKKVIKPPSAEYLASKLNPNPLGLTDMIPAQNRYGDEDIVEAPPQTPWIWNPANLEHDEPAGRNQPSSDSREPSPGRRSMEPPSMGHDQRTRPSDSSLSRQTSEPIISSSRPSDHDTKNHRHPTDPTSNGRNGAASSTSLATHSGLDRPLDRPKNPEYYQRRGYTDGYQPPVHDQRPDVATPAAQTVAQEPESFTAKRELQPTFSTNIVRTPMHYRSQSSRSSSAASSREHSQSSLDSVTSRVGRMGVSDSPNHAPLSRHSSISSLASSSSTSSSFTGVSSYVDEPLSVLSPLMLGPTPKLSARPIERYHTYPDVSGQSNLGTIAEYIQETPRRRENTQQQIPPDTYDSYPPSASPARRSASREPTPPRTPSKLTPPREGGKHITPSPNGGGGGSGVLSNNTSGASNIYLPPNPLINNPLPPPPREVRYLPISPPPRVGPPPANRERRRRGFWNRRGDHMTSAGYIVYAPPDQAYPEELRDYPGDGDGYKDNFGTIIAFHPDRPELPESLPRHGKPPLNPYDTFLVYDLVP